MWKAVRHHTYRLLYWMGKTPPAKAEVEAALDRAVEPPAQQAAAMQAVGPAGKGDLCDCLVTAGNKQVGCFPNKSRAACHLIGDTQPGLNGTPLPLGSCKNM